MNGVTLDKNLVKLLIQTYHDRLTPDQILMINRFAIDQDCPDSLIFEQGRDNTDMYLVMAVMTDSVNCWVFLRPLNTKSLEVTNFMFQLMKNVYIDPSRWSPKIFAAYHAR